MMLYVNDWVTIDVPQHDIKIFGYITSINIFQDKVYIHVVNGNKNGLQYFNQNISVNPGYVTKVKDEGLTVNDLMDAIDLSLDLKNKPLFYQLTNSLNRLIQEKKSVNVK